MSTILGAGPGAQRPVRLLRRGRHRGRARRALYGAPLYPRSRPRPPTSGRTPLMLSTLHRAEVAGAQGEHVWNGNGLFGQAMDSDQTKSRRIQAFDGRRSGLPTGLEFSNVMPSVPSSLTEDTA